MKRECECAYVAHVLRDSIIASGSGLDNLQTCFQNTLNALTKHKRWKVPQAAVDTFLSFLADTFQSHLIGVGMHVRIVVPQSQRVVVLTCHASFRHWRLVMVLDRLPATGMLDKARSFTPLHDDTDFSILVARATRRQALFEVWNHSLHQRVLRRLERYGVNLADSRWRVYRCVPGEYSVPDVPANRFYDLLFTTCGFSEVGADGVVCLLIKSWNSGVFLLIHPCSFRVILVQRERATLPRELVGSVSFTTKDLSGLTVEDLSYAFHLKSDLLCGWTKAYYEDLDSAFTMAQLLREMQDNEG